MLGGDLVDLQDRVPTQDVVPVQETEAQAS
jgi:hypothetical protein